jgi:hypothetical protein
VHSMRIYPHLQDTGGFFVAVLQRKSVAKEDYDPVVNSMYDAYLILGTVRKLIATIM